MEEKEKGLPVSGNQTMMILVGLLVVAAFMIGSLWTRVHQLEKDATNTGTQALGAGTQDNQAQEPIGPDQPIGDIPEITDQDHIRGSLDATIAIVEYSDLECPYCKSVHPTIQQLMDEYGDEVMWVYRHFPLDQLHTKADKEAEATECAAEQGGNDAFWAMVDKIFEATPSNDGLNLADLPKLAQEVGLDADQLKDCLDKGKYTQAVEDQYQGGLQAGVSGTPGIIILNTKTGEKRLIPGALPFDSFKQVIDEML